MVSPTEQTSGSQISAPENKSPSNSDTDADLQKAHAEAVVLDASPASIDASASDASGKCETSSDINALSANDLDHSESTGQPLVSSTNLPASALSGVSIFMGRDGNAYMEIQGEKNAIALRIGGKPANRVLRHYAHQAGNHLKAYELRDINEELTAHAEHCGDVREVYYRCAPFQAGVELDMGNDRHTRIRITPGKVAVVDDGSKTLFHRTTAMRSLSSAAAGFRCGVLKPSPPCIRTRVTLYMR